jgi:hypothetical protein
MGGSVMAGNIRLYNTSGYVELQAPSSASAQVLELPTDSIKPGLVHLHTESFSAVSSVSIDDVFSSTYTMYRVTIFLSSMSANTVMLMKFRNSGSDLSAAGYLSNNRGMSDGGTLASHNFSGATTGMSLGFTSSAHNFGCVLDVFDPAGTQRPIISGQTQGQLSGAGGFASWRIGGKYNAASTANGMSLIASSGTITGNLRVYGYRNS